MALHSLSFKKKKKLSAALFLSKSQAHAVQQKLTVVTVCPQQSWIQIEIEIASLNPPTHTHTDTHAVWKRLNKHARSHFLSVWTGTALYRGGAVIP